MAIKVTLFFKERGQGWSENYYSNAGSVQDVIGTPTGQLGFATIAGRLIALRVALLNSQASIIYVRASTLVNPRVSLGSYTDELSSTGTFQEIAAPTLAPPAEIDTCLVVRLVAVDFKQGRLFLGGLPETIITPPQTYSPTAAWNAAFANFAAELENNQWLLVGRPPITGAIPLSSFDTAASAYAAVAGTGVTVLGANLQGEVILRGIKGPRGWNGIHLGRQAAANSLTTDIGPTRRAMVTLPPWTFLTGGGTIQAWAPTDHTINRVVPEYIGDHKRGRFFGQARGRRSRA